MRDAPVGALEYIPPRHSLQWMEVTASQRTIGIAGVHPPTSLPPVDGSDGVATHDMNRWKDECDMYGSINRWA